MKVRCGRYWSLQQDGVPSHTARNTETCKVRTNGSLSQTFCPPNSPDLNMVNLPPEWSLADGLPSYFLLSWQNEVSDCQKHGRNYHRPQSLPINHFYHILLTVNVIRQMAALFSKVDSNKLWHDVQNEETVICAKYGKDLFSISKVIGCKTKWPRFFGLPCTWWWHVWNSKAVFLLYLASVVIAYLYHLHVMLIVYYY